MSIELTDQQQNAIESRNCQLVVSAAAGSGKTAVLVRRVIGLICDEAAPVDIRRLVVVTFTNAAAAEMRSRIASALQEKLALDPLNRHLRRQLAMLPQASIQTIHGFCRRLIQENFTLCGVSPDFTLADDITAKMLMDEALEAVLEDEYQRASPDFTALCQNVCEEKGDRRLCEAVLDIANRLSSHPNPNSWLSYIGGSSQVAAPEITVWGRYLMADALARASHSHIRVCALAESAAAVPAVNEKYGKALAYCTQFSADLVSALKKGWDDAYALLQDFQIPAFSACRYEDKAFLEELKNGRDAFRARIEGIKKECISVPAAQITLENEALAPCISALCRVVSEYLDQYSHLKAGKSLLDFSDLEHMALALLQDSETGKQSPLAKALSKDISELLVDEYQDTNEVQEQIFTLLAPEGAGAFFVGDVKQSIYRFRLANPDIFLDRYHTAVDFASPLPSQRRRLSLNRNFRSRQSVLDVCNFIMSRVMSRDFGDIDYTDDEALHPGASFEGACPSELYVIDGSAPDDGDEDDASAAQLEARLVAGRISEMLIELRVTDKQSGTQRPARPSDFAVLLSSFKSKAPAYASALSALNIPSSATAGSNIWGSVEISVILSLLRIIDNRRQDIPLISVLRSPLYFATPDRLATIRQASKGDFYDCITACDDDFCHRFIADLDALSLLSQHMSVSALLEHIYVTTGARALFGTLDNGGARRENLDYLVAVADIFEGGKSKGLYAFLRFIDRKIAEGEKSAPGGSAQSCVQLLSIHGAKGLEYPVVFLPDLSKGFNTDDIRRGVLFHPDLGIAMKRRVAETHCEYKTQLYSAVASKTLAELRCEELRKLYVAMTRAREKLVMVMSFKNIDKTLSALAPECADGKLSPAFLASCNNSALWLCAAFLNHPSCDALRNHCGKSVFIDETADKGDLECHIVPAETISAGRRIATEAATAPEGDTDDFKPLLSLIPREYAHKNACALPSKLTPTGAKKLLENTAFLESQGGGAVISMYQSLHLTRRDAKKSANRGTLLHAFMQLADISACVTESGAALELERLVKRSAFTLEQGAEIDSRIMPIFLATPYGKAALHADKILREYEFGVLMTPDEVLKNGITDEQMLMNGTIDMLIFEADGITILDFKSDRVPAEGERAAALKYRLQLDIYTLAVEKIFALPIKRRTIYFLSTATAVDMP